MTKTYYGTKSLKARSMTRGQYCDYRGWEVPKNENPGDYGYLVEYLDGGQPNDDRHVGYISWAPKDVFEAAYRPTDALDFGHALRAVKDGFRVARKGWNGKGMFIFLVNGSRFVVNREPLLSIMGEGAEVQYRAHVDMKTADGQVVPWFCTQTDMLADDWQIVPDAA